MVIEDQNSVLHFLGGGKKVAVIERLSLVDCPSVNGLETCNFIGTFSIGLMELIQNCRVLVKLNLWRINLRFNKYFHITKR